MSAEQNQDEETLFGANLGSSEIDHVQREIDIYALTVPRPSKGDFVWWKKNSFEVIALIFSAIGSIVLSALRVGTILFLAEISLSSNYAAATEASAWFGVIGTGAPTIAFLSGMFTFEGYLFAHGYRKGKERKDVQISNWGLVIAFIATMSAGLLSSFGLDTGDASALEKIIQWLVIISTGIGAPIIAYFGAFNIAVVQNTTDSDFDTDDAKWRGGFTKWYNKRNDAQPQVAKRAEEPQPQQEDDTPLTQQVKDLLDELNLTAHQIGLEKDGGVKTPAEIAHMLGQEDSNNVRVILTRLRKDT